MDKYDVRFCSCGRVHFIPESKVNTAIEQEKEVLMVCNNCGVSFVIGADKTKDDDGKLVYMMYSYDIRNGNIEDTSKIATIVFTAGEKVMMKTGNEATYNGKEFIDWATNKPEHYSIKEWDILRRTVDTEATIDQINDDNKLNQMSNYCTGIDWKGTKYEK